MRRDDTEYMPVHQLPQDRFGQRTADQRLGTRTHLIHQHQRPFIRLPHKRFHVTQMTRIGGEFILYRLLVSDIDHQSVKKTRPTLLRHRYQQSALEHVLQQSHGLQTHGLTAGIRTGYHQHMVLLRLQAYRERHYRLTLRRIMHPQHRMTRVRPVDQRLVHHLRPNRMQRLSQRYFGIQKIHLTQ